MKTITSRHNEEIKAVSDLQNGKERTKNRLFIAEGTRVIETFMAHSYRVQKIYATETMLNNALKLTMADQIILVNEDVMKKISSAHTPSGILAVFHMPTAPSITDLERGVVLAQISDPGNMGTLIRTAAAMNIKTVVVVEGCDPWSAKVVQASAGTIAQVNLFVCSWQTLLEHKKSLQLCALVVHNGTEPNNLPLYKTLLVVGNESQGLPISWQQQCELAMTIPMPGNTESLNAAVAGSIAMYLMAIQP